VRLIGGYSSRDMSGQIKMTDKDWLTDKDWTPTGVGTVEPFSLDDETKRSLLEIIQRPESEAEHFLKAVETAISIYRCGREFAKQTKPGTVRRNLKAVDKAADNFYNALNNLDTLSKHLLGQDLKATKEAVDDFLKAFLRTRGPDDLSRYPFTQDLFLRTFIQTIAFKKACSKALGIAENYPRSRLKDFPRLLLAIDIANTFEKHLGIKPTATKKGMYEQCLHVALKAAAHTYVSDLNALACEALALRKGGHQGTVSLPPDP